MCIRSSCLVQFTQTSPCMTVYYMHYSISRHCNQYAFIVTACSQTHADLQEAFEQPLIYVHVLLGAQVLSNSVVNLVE